MKRLAWVLLLGATAAFAACSSTQGTDAPIGEGPGDGSADVVEAGAPDVKVPTDASRDAEKKPDSAGPDSSFVAPAPVVNAMTPIKTTAGGPGPSLVVTGDKFVSWSVVRADGADLPTTFVSETELHALLPAIRVENAGVIQIDVFTTTPGGGKSSTLGFLVENPTPLLTAIAPTAIQVNSGDTSITLTGGSFAKTAKVSFDGQDLAVTASSPTSLTATVPAALLTASGSHALIVTNPAPGGGKSSPIAFIVTNPSTVSVTTVAPTHATLGSGDVSLSVDGSGFVSASVVSFNGINVQSTTTDQTHISATIPAALLASSGSFPIVVTNPAPGGGVSNPVQFEVWNPGPSVTSLSPNTAYYGGADRKISVLGTGFVPTSTVRVDGADVTTIYASPTQLDAIVPAATLASLGTRGVSVHTAGPGGGDSSSATLFVVCDPTGVDVALGAAGNVTTLFTEFASASPVKPLRSAKCPTTVNTSGTAQPERAWVVQNNQATSLTLSAWAVCTTDSIAEDDAFLALYRRPTAPTTDDERLQCTGFLSEGANGAAGDYRSPESNGSNWCPGLTKTNGGGLSLAACERAVVWVSPYSATSVYYTPPSAIRLKAE
ncbi:MAG: hypothetical protein U0235_35350 [Polyangiaceae bacterium]